MAEFKDMLRYFREREGLSQSELGKKIGVSASAISMYEMGNREPDFETEEKLADLFNTDLNTLRGKGDEYYTNPETARAAQEALDKAGTLFDAARDATPCCKTKKVPPGWSVLGA